MNSFLQGREAVSRQNSVQIARPSGLLPSFGAPQEDSSVVRLPETRNSAAQAAAPAHQHEKKVETVEVDGVVQKIIITCGCGERIEVHCGY